MSASTLEKTELLALAKLKEMKEDIPTEIASSIHRHLFLLAIPLPRNLVSTTQAKSCVLLISLQVRR